MAPRARRDDRSVLVEPCAQCVCDLGAHTCTTCAANGPLDICNSRGWSLSQTIRPTSTCELHTTGRCINILLLSIYCYYNTRVAYNRPVHGVLRPRHVTRAT